MSGRGWWMIVVLAGGWSCIGLPPAPPAGMEAGSTSGASSTGVSGNDTRLETSEGSMTGGMTTSTSTTGSADDSTSASGSSTGEGAQQEVLQRADFGGCAQPLWCFSDEIEIPAGSPVWPQECFTANTEPPFELVEVEAVIRGLGEEIDDVMLEVYGWSPDGPGALLASQSLDASRLVIGTNTFMLDPPLSLERQEICIGFAAPAPEPARALGVSVDPGSSELAASYLRMGGNGPCSIPDWSDVIELGPMPSGNWCIQATIQTPFP